MDNSQINVELDRAKQRLIKTLEQGEKMNNLTSAPEWEFFEGWIDTLIDATTKSVTSDSYLNDHNGYLKAVAQIQAYRSIKNGVEAFKRAYNNAAKKLDDLEYGDER